MKLLLAFMVIGVVGCATPSTVGTTTDIYVPKDSAGTCSGYCHEIGLELSSVVIMANNVGCVCSPAIPLTGAPPAATPPTPPTAGSTSAAAGMAALLVAEAARQQQEHSQRQQQQQRQLQQQQQQPQQHH
ncbi:MAG: hypothetical protein HOV81_28120 [Kofleriaceae bacterium]|nr:hypothetical protein [Kofleriaceae bacterium]